MIYIMFFMLFFLLMFFGMILIAMKGKSRSVVTDLEADIWPVEDFDEADEFNLKNKRLIYVNGKEKVGKAEWEKYSDLNIKFDVRIYSKEFDNLEIYLNGFHVGSAKKGVNYLDFKLKTELGDIVPEVNERDIITVRSGGNEVFKGRFYFD